MRAAILTAYGQPPEIGEFDDPAPSDGKEVVEVLAAGCNPVDLLRTSGNFYGGNPPLPSVVGSEGIARTSDGRTVYFEHPSPPYGSFAERTLIDPTTTYAVPDGLDPAQAVVFGIAGLAGWLALSRAKLQKGETVLVLGAGGVVGQVAVQAAKLLGAGRVVAAARSEDRLRRATEQGADATVQIGAVDDLAQAFRDAGGDGGIDVVVDPVWGEPAVAALDALNVRGRHVQLGQSAGAVAAIPSALIRGKTLDLLGHTNFAVPVENKRVAYEHMAAYAAAGELNVDVERVPLDDAPSAWERQRSSPGVKLVIVP